MDGLFLRYYIFKNTINNIDKSIINIDIDDNLLFNSISFTTSALFFNKLKKDKYDLYNKINDNLSDLLIESLISIEKHNDFNKLLFIYSLVTNKKINEYYNSYFMLFETSKLYNYNMIDSYLSSKEDFNLFNESIIKHYNIKFKFNPIYNELIKYPFVKLFKFFGTLNYFNKSYKNMNKFYKNKYHFKYKKYKMNEIKYDKKIDTSILNLGNNVFTLNNKNYNYSLDEFNELIIKDILTEINVINDYLFNHDDKKIRKYYNIKDEKKI